MTYTCQHCGQPYQSPCDSGTHAALWVNGRRTDCSLYLCPACRDVTAHTLTLIFRPKEAHPMNICALCGKGYETTALNRGIVESPSSRLVIEAGMDRLSKSLTLCPDCTDTVRKSITLTGKGREENAQ